MNCRVYVAFSHRALTAESHVPFQVEDGHPGTDHSDREAGELMTIAHDLQAGALVHTSEDEYELIDVSDDDSVVSYGTTYYEPLPFPNGFQAEAPVVSTGRLSVDAVKIESVSFPLAVVPGSPLIGYVALYS